MNNNENTNLDFLDMKKDGKIIPTVEKIKWMFIRNYTFISLICFIIYKIILYILDQKYIKIFNDFEKNILNIEQYIQITNMETFQKLVTCIILILSNFIVVFLSSILIFNKYKIKKEFINSLMKIIIIIECIFIGFISFEFSIDYINYNITSDVDEWRLVKISENNVEENYSVSEAMNIISITHLFSFLTLIISNIICSIVCIFIQKRTLKINSA